MNCLVSYDICMCRVVGVLNLCIYTYTMCIYHMSPMIWTGTRHPSNKWDMLFQSMSMYIYTHNTMVSYLHHDLVLWCIYIYMFLDMCIRVFHLIWHMFCLVLCMLRHACILLPCVVMVIHYRLNSALDD